MICYLKDLQTKIEEIPFSSKIEVGVIPRLSNKDNTVDHLCSNCPVRHSGYNNSNSLRRKKVLDVEGLFLGE
jgi:hypothetical protein